MSTSRKPTLQAKHPMQPLIIDIKGVIRFKPNAIVQYFLDRDREAGPGNSGGLNRIPLLPFSKEDREQFAQLIGYSLEGYGELDYVGCRTYNKAAKEAEKFRRRHGNKC